MRKLIERKLEEQKAKWNPKMTWEDWSLYPPKTPAEKKGIIKAVAAANAAMAKAKKKIEAAMKKMPEYKAKDIGSAANDIYLSVVEPVLEKYDKYGFDDTAVRTDIAVVALANVIQDHYGKKGQTKKLATWIASR